MHAPALVSQNEPTEVTFIEREDVKKQAFVTETEAKDDALKNLKDQADFLSAFTKRVKKQIIARNNGATKNVKQQTGQKGDPEGIAGDQSRGEGDEGFLRPGGGQAMRQVAIGQSSIAEFIPGIEEGAFTALNTDQFTYYTFFARMNEQVRNRWVSAVRAYMSRLSRQELESLSRKNRQTVVEIVLSRTGEFTGSLVHGTSGDGELDQTSVESFKRAAPFLNPPQGMVESDGRIRLKYAFHLRFRPPSFGPAEM